MPVSNAVFEREPRRAIGDVRQKIPFPRLVFGHRRLEAPSAPSQSSTRSRSWRRCPPLRSDGTIRLLAGPVPLSPLGLDPANAFLVCLLLRGCLVHWFRTAGLFAWQSSQGVLAGTWLPRGFAPQTAEAAGLTSTNSASFAISANSAGSAPVMKTWAPSWASSPCSAARRAGSRCATTSSSSSTGAKPVISAISRACASTRPISSAFCSPVDASAAAIPFARR